MLEIEWCLSQHPPLHAKTTMLLSIAPRASTATHHFSAVKQRILPYVDHTQVLLNSSHWYWDHPIRWKMWGQTTVRRSDCSGEEPHYLYDINDGRGGVIIIIIPLLVLTTDQMVKIEEALQTHGSVEAYHLDNILPWDIHTIIQRMNTIDYNLSSTLFIFTSPQYFTTPQAIMNALLDWHARKALHLVAIEEAHIYAQYGRSFREAMRILSTLFFTIVFKVGLWHPSFLAMTVTMTLSLLPSFSKLTNVD